MAKYELINRDAITQEQEAIWRDMCVQTMRFGSPVLVPDFSKLIHEVRGDVDVIVAHESGKPVGFLPIHKRNNHIARPAGAPFSDYTAFISYPDAKISLPDALDAVKVDKLQAIGLIDPYGVCGTIVGNQERAFGICQKSDIIANGSSKKHRKNYNRIKRHLINDYGEEHFVFFDEDEGHFQKMLEFKSAQTRETGVHDFLKPAWVKEFMHKLFLKRDRQFRGAMITLMANNHPICMHFGPSSNGRFHPWIATFDPKFAQYSPGQIFLVEIFPQFKEHGIDYYDLSIGESRYKSTYSNDSQQVTHGKVCRTGIVNQQDKELWNEETKVGKIHNKLLRRFDQIACLELDTMSRLKGAGFAFASAAKRIKK